MLTSGLGIIWWNTQADAPVSGSLLPSTAFAETLTYQRTDSTVSPAREISPAEIQPADTETSDTAAESTIKTYEEDILAEEASGTALVLPTPPATVSDVPFYSQFADITPSEWRKLSCGIASLAMLIDFYQAAVLPDTLLQQGIDSGAYIESAGWSHAGLIGLAKRYGLTGETRGLSGLSMADAFAELSEAVAEGPVMASVHYTFQPTNPIPHLVVVTGVRDGLVYYNDPAETGGGGSVSVEQFQSAWKKRYIEIRPTS